MNSLFNYRTYIFTWLEKACYVFPRATNFYYMKIIYIVFGNKYFWFQIMDFNYEFINEEFENDKVWVVILKFWTLTTLKTMVEFDTNPDLKFLIYQTANFKFSNEIIVPKHDISKFVEDKKVRSFPIAYFLIIQFLFLLLVVWKFSIEWFSILLM